MGPAGDITNSKYDTSCFQYLNSEDHLPSDWYEMMYNPDTRPSLEVAQEGRKEEIYQRNFDFITKFVEKLKQKVDSDPQLVIVTRETAMDLVQQEEGRQINKDTLLQISDFLVGAFRESRKYKNCEFFDLIKQITKKEWIRETQGEYKIPPEVRPISKE